MGMGGDGVTMTQKVFIKHEEVNTSFVWLYLERMFRKAFERSAFAFHTRVKEFCVLHKESKILGRDILYFGFTQTVFGEKTATFS